MVLLKMGHSYSFMNFLKASQNVSLVISFFLYQNLSFMMRYDKTSVYHHSMYITFHMNQ